MVDMLTILVVFLLQTFSASGELLSVQKNIVLPEAQNFKDLEQAPIIAVSKDSVTLDGRMVANAARAQRGEHGRLEDRRAPRRAGDAQEQLQAAPPVGESTGMVDRAGRQGRRLQGHQEGHVLVRGGRATRT